MLAVFDVEGVLVDGEFMPEIAKALGKEKEVWQITLAGIRGEIKWEDGFMKRIDLLKGVPQDVCLKVAESLPLMNGADELFRYLKKKGFKTIGVSGGPSLLVDRVKEKLGLDYALSNDLVFKNGRLESAVLRVTSNKVESLEKLIQGLGMNGKRISVIDGANDVELFEISDLRIAFNAQKCVKERADVVIDKKDLSELIPVIEKWLQKEEL